MHHSSPTDTASSPIDRHEWSRPILMRITARNGIRMNVGIYYDSGTNAQGSTITGS